MALSTSGTAELQAIGEKFDRLANDRDLLRAGRVAVAVRVADQVRVEAPTRTGALARSVGVDRGDAALVVTAGHVWPVQSGRRKGKRGGAQRANPFITRGIRRAESAAAAAVVDDLDRQINLIL